MDTPTRVRQNSKPIKCKCGNTWLQQITVAQINGDMTIALGQAAQVISNDFFLYKCHVCGDLNIPKVHLNTHDTQRKEYDNMIDSLSALAESADNG